MKIREHSIICELVDVELKVYADLIRSLLLADTAGRVALILKPSVVPVVLRGNKRSNKKFIVFPPFSFIEEDQGASVLYDNTCRERLRCFNVAEDVWVEGKKLLTTGERAVRCIGSGPLIRLANELGLTCRDDFSVNIVDGSLAISDYEGRLLNRRHVANAAGFKDVELKKVTGRLRYYWRTHPLLYGLPSSNLEIKIAPLSQFKKLSVIGKPLLYIEDMPLIIELPHNNSIIFLGFNEYLVEYALRSILYVL